MCTCQSRSSGFHRAFQEIWGWPNHLSSQFKSVRSWCSHPPIIQKSHKSSWTIFSSHLSPVCLSSVQLSRLFGWLGTNFSTVSANCFVFWPITIYWNQKGDWNRVFDCEMPWNAHHKFSEAPSNASIVISLNVLSPLAEWMRGSKSLDFPVTSGASLHF